MDIVYAFLALAGVFGALLILITLVHRLREPKHTAAWAQISSMIGGTYSSKIGLMYYRYKISGHYEGLPVEAFIEAYTPEDDPNYYNYHLRIKAGVGRQGWALAPNYIQTLDAGRGWDGESRDDELERSLIDGGHLELLMKDSGSPLVRYKADEGFMEYKKSVDRDTSVPTPDEFTAQFNLLKHLSELNKKLNAS
jgi:hypothetical protein